jgi:hypothetical protein
VRHERNIYLLTKLLFIFGIQMTILVALTWSFDTRGFYNSEHKSNPEKSDNPYTNLICKFLAAILLHAGNQPKIDKKIQWLKYIKYHPEKFVDLTIVISITYLKLLVLISCEFVNLMFLAKSSENMKIIMSYITFSVVSDIDSMYYRSIKSSLKKQLEKRSFILPITNIEQMNSSVPGITKFQLAWL